MLGALREQRISFGIVELGSIIGFELINKLHWDDAVFGGLFSWLRFAYRLNLLPNDFCRAFMIIQDFNDVFQVAESW